MRKALEKIVSGLAGIALAGSVFFSYNDAKATPISVGPRNSNRTIVDHIYIDDRETPARIGYDIKPDKRAGLLQTNISFSGPDSVYGGGGAIIERLKFQDEKGFRGWNIELDDVSKDAGYLLYLDDIEKITSSGNDSTPISFSTSEDGSEFYFPVSKKLLDDMDLLKIYMHVTFPDLTTSYNPEYGREWASGSFSIIQYPTMKGHPVPEPVSLSLVGLGLAGIAGAGMIRRRKK